MDCAALLVGWNGTEPGALQYAEQDCALMMGTLRELGFETIEALLPPTLSAEEVQKAFRRLAGTGPDLLLCFFAGHAEMSSGSLLIRLPGGSRKSSGIVLPEFLNHEKIPADTYVVCILDTCALRATSPGDPEASEPMTSTFAEFVGRPASGGIRGGRQLRSQGGKGAILYMLAASTTALAYEDRRTRSGVFTYHLTEELKTQARRATRLDLRSVFESTRLRLDGWARQTGRPQSPILRPEDGAGLCLREFPHIRPYVTVLAASPKDRLFAGSPRSAHHWRFSGGDSRCYEFDCAPGCAAFGASASDDEWLAVGERKKADGQGGVRLFHDRVSAFVAGKPRVLAHAERPFTNVAFSGDATLVASSSSAGEVRLWNLEAVSGKVFSTGQFRPGGEVLAIGYADDRLVVVTRDEVQTYRGLMQYGDAVQTPSPVMHGLISSDGVYHLWLTDGWLLVGDIDRGITIRHRPEGNLPSAVAVSQDGRHVAAAELPSPGHQGVQMIRGWRADDPATVTPVQLEHAGPIVTGLAFATSDVLYYATSERRMDKTPRFDRWRNASAGRYQ